MFFLWKLAGSSSLDIISTCQDPNKDAHAYPARNFKETISTSSKHMSFMFFWRDISQKKLTNVEGLDFAQSSLLTSRSHLDAGIHELSHRSGGLRSKIQKPSTCLGNKTGKKNICSHKKGYQLCKNCNYSVLGGVRHLQCLNLCTEMGRLFALWNRLTDTMQKWLRHPMFLCFVHHPLDQRVTKTLSQYFCSLRLESIPQLFEAASLAMFFKVLAAELKVCIGLAGGLRTTIRGCCPVDSLAKQKIKKKIWDFGVFCLMMLSDNLINEPRKQSIATVAVR